MIRFFLSVSIIFAALTTLASGADDPEIGKTVTKVVISESYLLGGKRCSTTLFIGGKLQLEKG